MPADEPLDAALVERAALAIVDPRGCGKMQGGKLTFCDECDCPTVAIAALLATGIPAAALNALARGEAVVVPLSPFGAQIAAAFVPQLEAPDGDPTSIAVYRAMLAASPYAPKE